MLFSQETSVVGFFVADALFSSDDLAGCGPAAAYFSCLAKKS